MKWAGCAVYSSSRFPLYPLSPCCTRSLTKKRAPLVRACMHACTLAIARIDCREAIAGAVDRAVYEVGNTRGGA